MTTHKILVAAVATSAVAVPVGTLAVPAFAATKTIELKDNFFAPKKLTVKKGTTLKFVWKGKAPHDVVGAGFKSKVQTKGTYSRKATRSGTIICQIHDGMQLKLTVKK